MYQKCKGAMGDNYSRIITTCLLLSLLLNERVISRLCGFRLLWKFCQSHVGSAEALLGASECSVESLSSFNLFYKSCTSIIKWTKDGPSCTSSPTLVFSAIFCHGLEYSWSKSWVETLHLTCDPPLQSRFKTGKECNLCSVFEAGFPGSE